MTPALPEALAEQLAAVTLDRQRPLIVSDADEVLFAFMAGFERFLESRDMFFDWRSFALIGNVRRRSDGEAMTAEAVRDLLEAFFELHTEALDPVPGAADALGALSERAQVVIVSNLPFTRREARRRALAAHGMDFPLIANTGGKGGAVAELARRVDGPVFFLDDIPHQHRAVREASDRVLCLHLVADPRLARLLGPAEHCHYRAQDWPDARRYIEDELTRLGF